jgi:hypothetical protein
MKQEDTGRPMSNIEVTGPCNKLKNTECSVCSMHMKYTHAYSLSDEHEVKPAQTKMECVCHWSHRFVVQVVLLILHQKVGFVNYVIIC